MRYPGVILGNDYHLFDDYAIVIVKSKKHGHKEIKIDLEDVEKCKKYTWGIYQANTNKCFYAMTHSTFANEGRISMHRFVMNCPSQMLIDHKEHDTLDNRKKNLRIADYSLNGSNRKSASKNNKLGVRNVRYVERLKKYIVRFKQQHIGCYETLEEAKNVAESHRKKIIENLSSSSILKASA